MKLTQLRHAYPEPAGFYIDRKFGCGEYTFLHFNNSVKIEQDGKLIETAPHAVILYDINTPQYFKSQGPLLHDWIHFVGDISPLLAESNLQLNKIYYPSRYDFITELIQEMESEFFSDNSNKERLMQLKLEELFLKLGRSISGEPELHFNFETKEKFRYLRGKMFSSLSENWTVARMANEVQLSESRFYAVYKAIYGISPIADLIDARINTAKNMLIFGNKKIDEIAIFLGYQNTTHFIRQFKKLTGVSPTHYRKHASLSAQT